MRVHSAGASRRRVSAPWQEQWGALGRRVTRLRTRPSQAPLGGSGSFRNGPPVWPTQQTCEVGLQGWCMKCLG